MKKALLVVILLALLALPACAAGGADMAAPTPPAAAPGPTAAAGGAAPAPVSPMPDSAPNMDDVFDAAFTADMQQRQRRLIRTADVQMHAEEDRFDQVVDALRVAAPNAGGFVEWSELGSYRVHPRNFRIFEITLRVPGERFEEVLLYVESLAHVTSSRQSSEDVTAQYYNILGRLDTSLIQQDRVLALIEQAQHIDHILELERHLGEIRTQIELYQAQLIQIDSRATYSTINVTLLEVEDETAVIVVDALGGRIATAFNASLSGTGVFLQETLIFLAGIVIPLSSIALFVLAGIMVAKIARRTPKADSKK